MPPIDSAPFSHPYFGMSIFQGFTFSFKWHSHLRMALMTLLILFSTAAFAQSEWTFLVYAAGDEPSIEEPSQYALSELDESLSGIPRDKVQAVVFHDQAGNDSKRSRKVYENLESYSHTGEANSGHPLTLQRFLRWGVQNFPAKHYVLILMGHGWGPQGLLQDFFVDGQELHEVGTIMTNYEVRRLLEELYRTESQFIPRGRFDAVVVDACISGQLEILYEWKDLFDYIAASPLETPNYAMPYREVFDSFRESLDIEEGFLKPLVAQFLKSHTRPRPQEKEALVHLEGQQDSVSFFAIRTEGLDAVARAVKSMSHDPALQQIWKSNSSPALSNLPDLDTHGDLHEMAKIYLEIDESNRAAQELTQALGYPEVNPTETLTPLFHAPESKRAEGVWVKIRIDEIAQREVAVCETLRTLITLNQGRNPIPLPVLRSPKGKEVDLRREVCANYAEEHEDLQTPSKTRLSYSIKALFDLTVHWPEGSEGYLVESPDLQFELRRDFYLWIPRNKNNVQGNFNLIGTDEVRTYYLHAHSADFPVGGDGQLLLWEEAFERPTHHIQFDFSNRLYVAEGHTNGTAFKQGIGIYLSPTIPPLSEATYQRGRTPVEKVERYPFALSLEDYFKMKESQGFPIAGEDFYRLHRIAEIGWADFLFNL